MLADLSAFIMGACSILTSRHKHSHRMVSLHHPRERGYESTSGGWSHQPHQGMEQRGHRPLSHVREQSLTAQPLPAWATSELQFCCSFLLEKKLLLKKKYFLIEKNFNYESLKTLTRLGIQMRWLLIPLPRHFITKQDNKFSCKVSVFRSLPKRGFTFRFSVLKEGVCNCFFTFYICTLEAPGAFSKPIFQD